MRVLRLPTWIFAIVLAFAFGASEIHAQETDPVYSSQSIDSEVASNYASETLYERSRPAGQSSRRNRTPAMIGDFYAGNPMSFVGSSNLDRLFVFANDLDVPFPLTGVGAPLALSEPGPVGIYSSTLTSIQDIQTILRAGQALPAATLAGAINDDASLVSRSNISQIQNQLAATGAPFDIILITTPPASYDSGVHTVFLSRNSLRGTTVLNSDGSGALLQGGVDTLNGGEDLDAFYFYDYVIRFDTLLADATSGGTGRMKIAEGGSVTPQDRVFFRYNHFSGVGYTDTRSQLNRFVPGFERTFMDSLLSFEIRIPFATDVMTTANVDNNAVTNDGNAQFGNVTMFLKGLLMEREKFVVSAGVGVSLPSASDITANYADGTSLLLVSNESVRIQPFLGALFTPNDRWFMQSFFQIDTAANGNTVSINGDGSGLREVGQLTDSTNMYFDVGLGYWLYRSNGRQGLTGIIPMFEIHQNSSFGNGDMIRSGPFQVSNSFGTDSLTNIVCGNTFEFAQSTHLTAAYTGPIGGGTDRQYNGGLQLFLSHRW